MAEARPPIDLPTAADLDGEGFNAEPIGRSHFMEAVQFVQSPAFNSEAFTDLDAQMDRLHDLDSSDRFTSRHVWQQWLDTLMPEPRLFKSDFIQVSTRLFIVNATFRKRRQNVGHENKTWK